MPSDLANLPEDVDELRRLILAERQMREAREAELAAAKAGLLATTLEMEKLKIQIARLRRMQFGRSSEKLDRQLELVLEELETATAELDDMSAAAAETQTASPAASRPPRSGRRPLPAHLPRTEIVHEPDCVCPACGGAMRKVGEDVTETLSTCPGASE